jgi:hypothetical protein
MTIIADPTYPEEDDDSEREELGREDEEAQEEAPAQAPSDTPLKLSHADLSELILALDEAIGIWQKSREEWADEDYEAGIDEGADEEIADIDAQLKAFGELQTRIKEERRHCERCRKVEPDGLITDFGQSLCGACYEAMLAD